MATYSYTTTAQQDADIAAQLAVVNAARVASGLSVWTAGQMILNDLGVVLAQYVVTRAQVNQTAVYQAWQQATPAQKTAAATALGVTLS